MSSPIPEQGQLVEVRRRQYVVGQVLPGTTAGEALGESTARGPQHLVTLSSIEDDGLGEELQVVWEFEAEQRLIRARYAQPEPRRLPVAVTFLIPAGLR